MKLLLAVLLAIVPLQGFSAGWTESKVVAELFNSAGVTGTFVLYDVETGRFIGHNQARSEVRFVPASTFKISNSLIGLAVEAATSVDEVLPYGGNPQLFDSWERDMGLREAITLSSVPIYQELARRIGLERMREHVSILGYGNENIGDTVDTFWLDGPLEISAVEQARFLARLAQGDLPVAEGVQASIREIVLLEQGENWRLYGKTGWENVPGPGIGWWVGWVEKDERVYAFALNLDIQQPSDARKRIEIGKASLEALGVTLTPTRAAEVATADSLHEEVREGIAAKYVRRGFDLQVWLRDSAYSTTDPQRLVASLRDPAARLLTPDQAQNFLLQVQFGSPPGIGLLELLCLDTGKDGRVTVITPVPGTTAAAADIRPGDVILAIDGLATGSLSLHEAARALQGKTGSSVNLDLERDGMKLQKRVVRAAFPSGHPAVRSATIAVGDRRVGYVGILGFAPGTTSEVADALAKIGITADDALVLDLRNNPGGALAEAIDVARLFLEAGTPIVTVQGSDEAERTFSAKGKPIYGGALAVLINRGSASAAELIAGAMQASGRARLYGEHSAGKGLVHGVEQLSDGSLLVLPAGRLLTPAGIDILEHGIEPDVRVSDAGSPVLHSRETGSDDSLLWSAARMLAAASGDGARQPESKVFHEPGSEQDNPHSRVRSYRM